MLKVKNIVISAICGFVLSFLISIISTHKSGVSLLRALIFGVVFAALYFGIDFVNSKFLSVDSFSTDSGDDVARKSSSGAGSVVNITIDDENLTEEDNAPSFNVSSGRSVFSYKTEKNDGVQDNPKPVEKAVDSMSPVASDNGAEASQANEGKSEFKPVELGTPISKDEVVKNDSPTETPVKKSSGVKEIDALPDIGEFASQGLASMDNGSDSAIINDSEFAQSGDIGASAAMTEGAEVMKQDSKIIASAIRTLLKKED